MAISAVTEFFSKTACIRVEDALCVSYTRVHICTRIQNEETCRYTQENYVEITYADITQPSVLVHGTFLFFFLLLRGASVVIVSSFQSFDCRAAH